MSTLCFYSIEHKECIRVALSYVPQTIYRSYNLNIEVHTNQNKMMSLLGSTKDKISDLKKSGIYSIKCDDCNEVRYRNA